MPEAAALRHGAIVLAAGRSQRLGRSKQLLCIDGETLIHRTARLALDTGPADCIVVCADPSTPISDAVADLACRCVPCPDAERGLSASLRCGIQALAPACAATLILLTDQPGVDSGHLQVLLEAWRREPEGAAASGYADSIGVPAVLPRAWFGALMQITGDSGARELLRTRSAQVSVVAAPQLEQDIDHPGDLERTIRMALK